MYILSFETEKVDLCVFIETFYKKVIKYKMKVVCVDNKGKIWKDGTCVKVAPITIGSIYDTLISSLSNEYYMIVNDNNMTSWESKENFLTMDEHRDNIINRLLR